MRGRKPVPTLLANLHGNPRKTKPNAAEPKPVGDLSDPPEWLSETQREGWLYALKHAPQGLLCQIDRGALLVWVVAEDLHRQACQAVAKFGLVMRAPITKAVIQSPYLPIVNRQGLIMLRAASELGFTPVSRPRIGAQGGSLSPPGGRDVPKNAPRRSLDDYLESHPATQH